VIVGWWLWGSGEEMLMIKNNIQYS
jgi:hypothetical protein